MPGVVRIGDAHVGHASPTPSPFHQTSYATGSGNVFVNAKGAVRIGDTTGCGDVFFSTFIYFYLTKKFSFQEIAFLSHVAAGLHGLDEGNKNVINKNIYFQSAQSLLK